MRYGLEVLERAPHSRLISVATVESRLGSSGESSLLADLIAERCSAIEAFLAFELVRQKYRVTAFGPGCSTIFLPRFPLDPDSLSVTLDGSAITDFEVVSASTGELYRSGGWGGSTIEPTLVFEFRAGYVPSEDVSTWSAATTVAAGAWLRPTSPALSPYLLEVTTAGDTGGTEPTYPAAGSTVADGSAVLTARQAEEVPAALRAIAWQAVQDAYSRLTRAPGIASIEADGFRETYFSSADGGELPAAVSAALFRWRAGR